MDPVSMPPKKLTQKCILQTIDKQNILLPSSSVCDNWKIKHDLLDIVV